MTAPGCTVLPAILADGDRAVIAPRRSLLYPAILQLAGVLLLGALFGRPSFGQAPLRELTPLGR